MNTDVERLRRLWLESEQLFARLLEVVTAAAWSGDVVEAQREGELN